MPSSSHCSSSPATEKHHFSTTSTAKIARTILSADVAFGVSAGAIVIVGLLRVFSFEKGAAYFHSIPFIAKLSVFVAIGLLSIYPTVQFLSWRSAL
jgi:putative membrane protein